MKLLAFIGALLVMITAGVAAWALGLQLIAAVALDVRDRWRAWRFHRKTRRARGSC